MLTDPSDLLKIYLEDPVFVKLKTGEIYNGILECYDEHTNILLTKETESLFIKGENIVFLGQNNIL